MLARRKEELLVLSIGFVLRVIFIVSTPITWGGDTIIRLFDRFSLTKAHQLPALQFLIAGVSLVSMDATLVRYLMAVIGAVAGLGFYWVAKDLFGEKLALPATLLFISHPFILAESTVPFQEILMLAGLLLAFHFFYNEHWIAASLAFAVACLTRYEAWAACPVLAIAWFLRKDRSPSGALKAALLFGWAPALWILAHAGLTQRGHYVIETSLSLWRLQRYVYLGWITAKFSQLPVLVLAGAGAWYLLRDRSPLDWRFRIQLAFLALFLMAIPFSAHGVMPDPERYVTSREAHIPMLILLLFAAAGLAHWPRWQRALVLSCVALGIPMAFWYVHTQTVFPDLQLDYRVAQYLDRSLPPGQSVLLLTTPLASDLAGQYISEVKKTGTPEDLLEAQREIQAAVLTPPDYQRVVVYSHLNRGQLLASPAACAEWAVVWNEYPDAARALAGAKPVEILRSGPLSASILRRHCPT